MTDGIALPPSHADMAGLFLGRFSENDISLGKAEIVDVPPDLQGKTVRGEVVAVTKDGTVTVRTESGEQIALKPKVPLPVGQKVSVEIPPAPAPGQTVNIKLASSPPAAHPQPVQGQQLPTRPVVEDTVAPSLQSRANVNVQSVADAVQLGKPVRTILHETPIRFAEIPQQPITENVNPSTANPVSSSVVRNPTNSMSMQEVLQQVETEFMKPASGKNDILLQQFVQRNILDKNDTLIRMVLGLKDNQLSYKPLLPLQTKTIDLPLLNRSFTLLNMQTSTLSLQPFSPNTASQHLAVDLPDLEQVIKAFQKNMTQNVLVNRVMNDANTTLVTARVMQVQNALAGTVISATSPQTNLMPLPTDSMQQQFQSFMMGNIIDADLPDNNLLRLIQNPLETARLLKPSVQGAISGKLHMVQAIFIGNKEADFSMHKQDGILEKITPHFAMQTPSGNPATIAGQQPTATSVMGLWVTPLGILALPSAETVPYDIGQNAVIQLNTHEGLSSLIKPVMTLLQPLTSPAVSGITNAVPALDSVLDDEWPALQKSIEALFDINVAMARSFMANIPMPNAPPQFTPAVIFFLAALRIGNLKAWTGEKMIDALERAGKGDLVKQLSGDFAHASARSKEPLTDGWRPFHIPVLYDENLSRLQFMVRQDNEEDGNGNGKKSSGKKATRFLIDLKLSRIGDIQLDGYIRDKNLDMIVRTKEQLPADMQQNIRQRFTHAVDMTGMNGSIRMFGRGEGWVKVERPSGASGVRV